MAPRSAVNAAVSLMMRPISATASMLMPALVVARLTDEQTLDVAARARGMDWISFRSPGVIPFCTRALKPPMKSMPVSKAARSRVSATEQ